MTIMNIIAIVATVFPKLYFALSKRQAKVLESAEILAYCFQSFKFSTWKQK